VRGLTGVWLRGYAEIGRTVSGQRPCCDDAGMATLTLDEITAKIATAESGYAAATSQYDRNVFAQILDEYKHYAAERTKEIAKQAAASSPAS
jgi:hypothetical protein